MEPRILANCTSTWYRQRVGADIYESGSDPSSIRSMAVHPPPEIRGLHVLRGGYIRFLDGDDFWNLPDALERLADAAFGV